MNVRRALLLNRTLPLAALLGLALSSSGCWTKLKPPAASGTGTGTAGGPAASGGTNPQANNATGKANGNGNANPNGPTPKHPIVVPTTDAVTAAKKDCDSFTISTLPPVAGVQPMAIPANLVVNPVSQGLQSSFLALSDAQKTVLSHLINAGLASRTVRIYQSNRYATALHSLISSSLASENAATLGSILSAQEITEWQGYAALFHQYAGPYNPGGVKLILQTVTAKDACVLVGAFGRKSKDGSIPLDPKDRQNIVDLLVNPNYEPIRTPRSTVASKYDDLANAGGNLYSTKITGTEAQQQIAQLAPSLNCRVIVDANSGKLSCEHLNTTNKFVGSAFTTMVNEFNAALKVTDTNGNLVLTKQQQANANALIKFLLETDATQLAADHKAIVSTWETSDPDAPAVDFLFGFLHTSDDFLGNIGSWESYVQLLNPIQSSGAAALAAEGPTLENTLGFGTSAQTSADAYKPLPTFATSLQKEADYNIDDVSPTKKLVLLSPMNANDTATTKARQIFKILHETIAVKSGTGPRGADLENTLGQEGPEMDKLREDMVTLAIAGDESLVTGSATDAKIALYANETDHKEIQHAMYEWYVNKAIQDIARDGGPMAARRSMGLWTFIAPLILAKPEQAGILNVNLTTGAVSVADDGKLQAYCASIAKSIQTMRAAGDKAGLATMITNSNPTTADWVKAAAAAIPQPAISVDQRWAIMPNQTSGNGTTVTQVMIQPCGDGTLAKFYASCGN